MYENEKIPMENIISCGACGRALGEQHTADIARHWAIGPLQEITNILRRTLEQISGVRATVLVRPVSLERASF
jgi:hypothetical protein